MKLLSIVSASSALQKLIRQTLPLRAAYDVMKLASKINPLLEFYSDELGKGRNSDELAELEIDSTEIIAEKIRLSLDLEICLTAADIWNLSPFIVFYSESSQEEIEKAATGV